MHTAFAEEMGKFRQLLASFMWKAKTSHGNFEAEEPALHDKPHYGKTRKKEFRAVSAGNTKRRLIEA